MKNNQTASTSMPESHFEINGYKAHVIWVNDSYYCGYVEVPNTHLCYFVSYSDNDYNNPVYNLDVHGGVTYTDSSLQNIESNDTWFIGFDAAHACDRTRFWDEGEFRDLDYMVNECHKLAQQLKKIEESRMLGYKNE